MGLLHPLHVLIVEDSEDDTLLLVRELERGGYAVVYERVDSLEGMTAALNKSAWDIVVSDYAMPRFSAPSALTTLNQKGLDVPFIVISGTVGEDLAVAVMKQGAHDYIMKQNLARLLPAVERELREAEERRARRRAEAELRRSEEQLRQSQKLEAIGRLAGGIAHDFNNFLTVIIGHSELMFDEPGASDSVRRNASTIKEAGLRAATLTHQLLAFGRKQVLQPRVLDLNEVIADLSRMFRRLIGEDIEVTLSLARDLAMIRADRSQIEQIIMNVVVNARDAMPDGGRLTISTATSMMTEAPRPDIAVVPGEYVTLSISDTGTGMSAETQERIFEPFFTTKERGKGSGLGLATVYGIVKQSRGYIWVSSELNHGTTFRIDLPKTEAVPDNGRTRGARTSIAGTETILVVEDEDAVRTLTCSILSGAGYRVLEARDGASAMTTYQQHETEISLLLTDAIMPGMGGRELVRGLHSRASNVRVLYVSGYADDSLFRTGVLPPRTSFLPKPFTREELLVKVREALSES